MAKVDDFFNEDYKGSNKREGVRAGDAMRLIRESIARENEKSNREIEKLQSQIQLLEARERLELEKAELVADSAVQTELIKAESLRRRALIQLEIKHLTVRQEIDKTSISAESHERRVKLAHSAKMQQLKEKALHAKELEDIKAKNKINFEVKKAEIKASANTANSTNTAKDNIVLGCMAVLAIPAMLVLGVIAYSVVYHFIK